MDRVHGSGCQWQFASTRVSRSTSNKRRVGGGRLGKYRGLPHPYSVIECPPASAGRGTKGSPLSRGGGSLSIDVDHTVRWKSPGLTTEDAEDAESGGPKRLCSAFFEIFKPDSDDGSIAAHDMILRFIPRLPRLPRLKEWKERRRTRD